MTGCAEETQIGGGKAKYQIKRTPPPKVLQKHKEGKGKYG